MEMCWFFGDAMVSVKIWWLSRDVVEMKYSSVDMGLRLSGSVEMWWPSEDLAAQFRRG